MQLLIRGEKFVGWVGECCNELGTLIDSPFVRIFQGCCSCQWGRVAVIIWTGDGKNLRGWGGLMLW